MYQTLTSLEPPLPCRFALAPWRPGAGRFGRKNRPRPPPLGPSGGHSRSSKRLSWRTPHSADVRRRVADDYISMLSSSSSSPLVCATVLPSRAAAVQEPSPSFGICSKQRVGHLAPRRGELDATEV